jgi:hypothetical protein
MRHLLPSRRCLTTVVLVCVLSVPLAAIDFVSLDGVTAARLAPLNSDSPYGPGLGERVSIAMGLGSVPVEVAAGLGAYIFGAQQKDFDTAYKVIPEISAAYAPYVGLGTLVLQPFVGLAYRHYVSVHRFEGTRYMRNRPIASVSSGVRFRIAERFLIGPVFAYDMIFDPQLVHVMELGIDVRYQLVRS